MPLTIESREQTRERLERDPDFRDLFLTEARNMYRTALKFDPDLEDEINRFEQIMGADPGSYEFDKGEDDELDIFKRLLNAHDKQRLFEDKEPGTIN